MARLAGADALTALDPVFARLAVGAGHNLWGLRHLAVREKTFVCPRPRTTTPSSRLRWPRLSLASSRGWVRHPV
jgi:hypothetical protein